MRTGIDIGKLLDQVQGKPERLTGLFRALAVLPTDYRLPDAVVERWSAWLWPDQSFIQQLQSSVLIGPPALRWNAMSLLAVQPIASAQLSRLLFRVALLDPVPAVRQQALETLASAPWTAGCPLTGGDVICHQALVASDEPLRAAGIRLAMRFGLRGVQVDLQRIAENDPSPNLRQLAGRGLAQFPAVSVAC